MAVGDLAQATGFHSTAVGGESVASGRGAQAFGWQARATGNLSLASGHQANAAGVQSTAVGKNSSAAADNSTAVGFGATVAAGHTNSTAVGTGATTTAANQVTIGGAGSHVRLGGYTTAGVLVNDANGIVSTDTTLLGNVANLQTGLASLQTTVGSQGAAIATLQGQTAALFDLATVNQRDIRRANEGVAMALAMESPSLPAGAHFAVSGGVGYYNERVAGTAAFTARIGQMSSFSAGVGVGLNSGEVGARAGFQAAW